eukprot:CAMPEP_0195282288 /NCGR_PEP_ID=MMETSP0707-20130614/1226_1 /TAXON_ID=33640 /ORGANISM="Asterionellopsis glacialis, Strain CCMP134" /LENGTH=442 /DNA_ID=CAMNT_0040341245 /DNA_START=474 /DNA_END=1799 /DNA_ORIENTATION=+
MTPPQHSGRRCFCLLFLLSQVPTAIGVFSAERNNLFLATATFPKHGSQIEEKISVVHLTCFTPYGAGNVYGDVFGSSAESKYQYLMEFQCCDRFSSIMEHSCSQNNSAWSSICGEIESAQPSTSPHQHAWCLERIARIPSFSNDEGNAVQSILRDWKPTYSLVLSSTIDADSSRQTLQTNKCGQHDEWNQLVLDEDLSIVSAGKGNKFSNVNTPFSLTTNDFSNHDDLQDLDTFKASVDTELSSSGGMHRTLHVNVSLSYAEDAITSTTSKLLRKGSLTLYLFLPEGVFMDVDDPFEDVNSSSCRSSTLSSCSVELIRAPHEVIDIEQPAFVSPQHVVALQVTLEGEIQSTKPIEEIFTIGTKIHLRYPRLVSKNETHVPVTIPAPFVHAGTLELGEQIILKIDSTSPHCRTPITVHVAAGNQDDYVFVTLTTVILSILGSW